MTVTAKPEIGERVSMIERNADFNRGLLEFLSN
jgi:hypothetical protein